MTLKRAALGIGGLAWFLLVFLITWWLTFPSTAVEQRLEVEVSKATGGSYQLALSDVSPWWTGVSASNVILSEVKTARGSEAPEATPLFAFEAAWVRAGLVSLLRRQPRVVGAVQIGSSQLDFDVHMSRNKRGTELTPRSIEVSAEDFPLQDLFGMAGATVSANGGVDFAVELSAEDGMRDATGEVRIEGENLTITSIDPELTGGMDLGMEIPIERIDIRFDVDQGKATVKTGKVESSLVSATIDGDLTLREDLQRSSLNLTFALDLGDELAMFETFLKRAQWADGTFHYRCSGTFMRPSCREEPERGGRASRAGSTTAGDGDEAPVGGRRGRAAAAAGGEPAPRSSLTPEEREKRRQEALERLRASRERRGEDGGVPSSASGGGEELPDAGEPDEGGEEPPDEVIEEPLPEDLPEEEPVFEGE